MFSKCLGFDSVCKTVQAFVNCPICMKLKFIVNVSNVKPLVPIIAQSGISAATCKTCTANVPAVMGNSFTAILSCVLWTEDW